jgi:2-polyprenyl-6-methoxyphenol hydroxylase-like FAD-dependent oxidoreductase
VKAIVVGGGIGGLSAAAGLHRIGWDVTVLERHDTLREIGAGISLMPSAQKALDQLGVGDALRAIAAIVRPPGVRAPNGRRIMHGIDPLVMQQRGLVSVALLRADLLSVIGSAVPAESVITGAEATKVTEDGGVAYRKGDDHLSRQGDLVVVADGISSRLRRQLWPDAPAPAYSGHSVWQGATTRPVFHPEASGNTWGRGHQFGRMPLAGGRVGWYAVANTPAGSRYPDEHAEVLRRFGSWHDPIPEIIAATEVVLHHDSNELRTPLSTFVQGRVALLGDAAHPMTSDIGQGACQAIEDAVVLCANLQRSDDLPTALRRYDEQRRPHTWKITEASHSMGKMTMLEHPLAVLLRDRVAGLLPSGPAVKATADVGGWTPPSLDVSAPDSKGGTR